jgi:outer membrane protein assembly factor BamB
MPPRWWRWLGLAVAALLSVSALVAAAPQPGGRFIEVAQIDRASAGTMRVAGSMLFAATTSDGPNVAGYRLADGVRLWSTPLPRSAVDAQVDSIDVVDGAVLVDVAGPHSAGQTIALDAATGRQLWRSDLPQTGGFPLSIGSTVVLAAHLDRPGGTPVSAVFAGPSDVLRPLLLHAVDARSGRPVWTYQVPAGWQTILPYTASGADPASVFVVIAPNGHATAVDLATGTVRASATVDASTINQSSFGRITGVYGDQLLLATGSQDAHALAVYRVDTLGLQWTATLPAGAGFASRCGTWLCVGDDQATQGFARDTGVPAWNVSGLRGWAAGWLYDSTTLDPNQSGESSLVDPTTRRVVLNLGRWRIVALSNPGPVLMTLVDRDSSHTWFALLAAGPRVDILGATTVLTITCQVSGDYVACLTRSQQVRIWRYRE